MDHLTELLDFFGQGPYSQATKHFQTPGSARGVTRRDGAGTENNVAGPQSHELRQRPLAGAASFETPRKPQPGAFHMTGKRGFPRRPPFFRLAATPSPPGLPAGLSRPPASTSVCSFK